MQVTMKHYTSTRYTKDQLKSLRQRIQIVSTAPVNFFYKGERIEIDHIGVHLTERRYGFDLTFAKVLEFPEIPEGHEVAIQMISTHGDPDSERYIGSFNIKIAPPSLQSRFHEYFTKDVLPVPLSSTLSDVTEDVAELAVLMGEDTWSVERSSGKYTITIDNAIAAKADTLDQLHTEFLRGVAMSARFPNPDRFLGGCFEYGRTGKCQ